MTGLSNLFWLQSDSARGRISECESNIFVAGRHEQLLLLEWFDGVEVFPLRLGDGPDSQRGGCVKNGQEIDIAKQLRARREQRCTSTPLAEWAIGERRITESLGGSWLYGGCLYEHFGHFASESIHRLWPLLSGALDDFNGVLFLGYDSKECGSFQPLRNYHYEAFGLMGIDPEKIYLCNQPVLVDRLAIPCQASTLGPLSEASDEYLELLGRTVRAGGCDLPRKVYVSRTKLSGTSRLIGEKILERRLEYAEYFILHPQEKTLYEQLSIYAGAEQLVFCEGSAVHGMELLGRVNAKIFLISRGGLKSRRIMSMKSVLRKRTHDFIVFDEVRRHPPIQWMKNALGRDVPAHWLSGVWIDFPSLRKLLSLLGVPRDLCPTSDEYVEEMGQELASYLLDLNIDILSTGPSSVARAMEIFLCKINRDLNCCDGHA